jgi:hypothetical protein
MDRVGEAEGDALEDPELVIGALEGTVGDPVGVVEGKDLVAPGEQGVDDLFVLGQRLVLEGGDEGAEGLVGGGVVGGEVDAVEVLQQSPRRRQLGLEGEDTAEGFDAGDVEAVEAGQLEVAAAEDVGVEGGSGAGWALALDTAADLDESGGEP